MGCRNPVCAGAGCGAGVLIQGSGALAGGTAARAVRGMAGRASGIHADIGCGAGLVSGWPIGAGLVSGWPIGADGRCIVGTVPRGFRLSASKGRMDGCAPVLA